MSKKKKRGRGGAAPGKRNSDGAGSTRRSPGILKRCLAVSAFCLIFSLIYLYFSHGIVSPWMQWLCLWPLLLEGLPALLQERRILPEYPEGEKGEKLRPGELMHDFCHFGTASLTAASLLKGILEIAGTDSFYPDLLLGAGALLYGAGAVYYVLAVLKEHKQTSPEQRGQ